MSTMFDSLRCRGRLAGALSVAACLLLSAAPVLAEDAPQDAETSPEERAKVRVFEALDLMDAGSYGEARLMLQLALGLNAELDRAWYYLAQCNVELKNWDEALDALAKYEGGKLSEHERMQIVDLRGTIEAGRSAGASSAEPAGSGDAQGASDAAADTAPEAAPADRRRTAPEEARDDTASAASAPARAAVPRPLGPIIMAIGGAVAGVGFGFMVHGLLQAQDAETHAAGEAPYYRAVGITVAGGVVFAAGIPLTIAGAKSPAKVVISYQGDAVQSSAGVYLMGRW